MRIGEIAVVAPNASDKRLFIRGASDSVNHVNERLAFGTCNINTQLTLHLYGITITPAKADIAWDFIAHRLLGYIVLFQWGDSESFRSIQPTVDELTSTQDTALITAGYARQPINSLSPVFEKGVPIDRNGALTFCNLEDRASIKTTLLALIEKVINQIK